MFTSITLDKGDALDLAQEIVAYIKKKAVRKVAIHVTEELKQPVQEIFTDSQFKRLEILIRDILMDDGRNFFLDIPEIATSFEEFSYGIEVNSYEEDFRAAFDRYIDG